MRIMLAALSFAILLAPMGCRPAATKNPEPAPVAQADAQKEPPKKDPPIAAKADPAAEPFKRPPTREGSVVRRVDEIAVKNMMQQLKIATQMFQDDRKRYPNSQEELESYYEKSTKINEALKEGDIVYLWKARKTEEPEKSILAYEGQPSTALRRVVLLANGEIMTVSDEEFKAFAKIPTAK